MKVNSNGSQLERIKRNSMNPFSTGELISTVNKYLETPFYFEYISNDRNHIYKSDRQHGFYFDNGFFALNCH